MMKKITFYLLVSFLFMSAISFAQGTITGTVSDSDLGGSLPGANIIEQGTNNGAIADFDGNFSLNVSGNSGTIVVSYVGYSATSVSYTLTNGATNVGTISLTADANALEEVVVIGTGIIDLAEDRKTPVAVSTVKAKEIQAKAGNFDLPEVLKSTPSVQSLKGGGFGEGQMFLRGFDQTNTAFLLNGQPINGMEDGKMYWSNWSGVLDVATAVQVQRGLGASKLAISSVGGTVNIVTKTIDKKEGGFVQQMIGNDDYTKTTAYYSTGVNEKGWSFSGLFGHWEGEGYVDHTNGQGQTYFLSVGYQPNENHSLNFLLTGAPQWHAAAGSGSIQDFLDNGRKYNSWNETGVNSPNSFDKAGTYPGGRNIYHKPVANLSWDWNINEKSELSSVLYGSLGRGAFASEKITNGVGYVRGSFNNHNWFGLVTNYNNELSETLNLNLGFDVRMYNGIHFRGVNEFIGIDSIDISSGYSGDYTITETYGGINPWNMVFNPNTEHDQRRDRDYEEVINYYGVFGQLEYAKNNFSAFFQGAVSNQDHQREEFFFTENIGQSEKSKKISNIGYNTKLGASYAINNDNKVFVNAGYYSRQPFHDDLYVNTRNSNDLIDPEVENQTITGLEAGYQFKSGWFSANLNAYHTIWDNRTLLDNNGELFDTPAYRLFQTQGVKQVHSGVELEVFTKPTDGLSINGFLSLGDWKYDGSASRRVFDTDGGEIADEASDVDLDGLNVGGAAKVNAGINSSYMIAKGFSIDAAWNWYNDLHSQGNFSKEAPPLSLPSYNTVDGGLSYKWLVGKDDSNSIQFRLNVNNVFDEVYLESVSGNTPASVVESENYKGVNTSNRGRFGYGRTWNLSARFNF